MAFVEATEANGTSKCLVEVRHPVKSMPCWYKEGVGNVTRKATVAEHKHMSGRSPAKHSTAVFARKLGTRRPKTRR